MWGKEEYTFGFVSSKAHTLISFAGLQVSYCNIKEKDHPKKNIKEKDSNLLVAAR